MSEVDDSNGVNRLQAISLGECGAIDSEPVYAQGQKMPDVRRCKHKPGAAIQSKMLVCVIFEVGQANGTANLHTLRHCAIQTVTITRGITLLRHTMSRYLGCLLDNTVLIM